MWEIQNLKEKLDSLPEPVHSYATSLKAAEINSQLFSISGVDMDRWAQLTLLIAGIIVKEMELKDLEKKIKDFLEWDEEKSLSLAIEIVGSRFLICDDWLGGEAEKYLKNKEVNLSRYAAIIAEHQLAISREAEFYSEQLKETEDYVPEKLEESDFNDVLNQDTDEGDELEEEEIKNTSPSIDIEEEKRGIIKTLQKGMLEILNSNDSEVLHQFNYSFVLIWGQDEKFSLEAPAALLANKEKISNAKLIVDGEEQSATISGLIKSFIKSYGLSANDLNIAEFLSSKTVSALSDKEKVMALRVLKFNNNINNLDTYLQSDLENVPSGFEVLSPPAPPSTKNTDKIVAREEKVAIKEEGVKVDDSKKEKIIETPRVINKTKGKEGNISSSPKDIRSAEQLLQPETSSLANELEKMLQDYTEGTLEYKTILQEIKRLKSSK